MVVLTFYVLPLDSLHHNPLLQFMVLMIPIAFLVTLSLVGEKKREKDVPLFLWKREDNKPGFRTCS
jgi:hypothetical protein